MQKKWPFVTAVMILIVAIGSAIYLGGQQTPSAKLPSHTNSPATTQVAKTDSSPAIVAINIGAKAMVPAKTLVDTRSSGSRCFIEVGGTLEVVAQQGPDFGVQYSAPGVTIDQEVCRSGVRFIVSKSVFNSMAGRYEAVSSQANAEKAIVQSLLAKNSYDRLIDAGDWQWVNIVNPEPVKNVNASFTLGDKCGIGRNSALGITGGQVRIRGKVNGQTLYEYIALQSVSGPACPSGTLFFGK